MDAIVFSNLAIIDGSGKKAFPGEVRVQGNRIAAIARDGKTLPRENARHIDGGGATPMSPQNGRAGMTTPGAKSIVLCSRSR